MKSITLDIYEDFDVLSELSITDELKFKIEEIHIRADKLRTDKLIRNFMKYSNQRSRIILQLQ
jgi:hypothetical protein